MGKKEMTEAGAAIMFGPAGQTESSIGNSLKAALPSTIQPETLPKTPHPHLLLVSATDTELAL